MNTNKTKKNRRRVHGTKDVPRLSVFRSNRYIYLQLIDDESGRTIAGISEKKIVASDKKAVKGKERAKELGVEMAKIAIEKKIKKIVFDKGSYRFHGRVKEIADGARSGGLQF